MHVLRPHFSKLLAAVVGMGVLVSAARAQFSYTESFANNTAAGWSFYTGNSGPGARLTSGATPNAADPEYGSSAIDPSGQGWLRLATTTSNQANAAYFNSALPSLGNDITIKFSVAMWGDKGIGNGGDGLTFFMRDASQDFSVGAFGGSIGYAQKTGIDGVAGGYFGVAFDVYGNYSAATEGRQGGVGEVPNAVVVRGPGDGQSGYNYLAGTGGYNFTASGSPITKGSSDPSVAALPYSLSFPSAADRPNQATAYRNVEITLSSTSLLTVKMQFGETGNWSTVLSANMSSFERPDMMSFGFSSGTGDANQVYEIGNTFSVNATAASNTYFWDNGAANNSSWSSNNDGRKNWKGDANPPAQSNIIFNDAYVSAPQNVRIIGGNKTVGSLYFSGAAGYTINSTDSSRLIFDAPGAGPSYLSLTNSATGNASHTINSDITLANDLVILSYVADKSLALNGDVSTGGNDITVSGPGGTLFGGAVSGGGSLTKLDGGVLTFATSAVVSSLVLDGGTLLLDSSYVLASSLHVTGDSVLDFGTGGASILGLSSLTIDAGVTLTVKNWTDALDYFYVNSAPTAGALSQVVFSGSPLATGWRSLDKQIRPVPEPSTYGALLIGALLVFFFFQRRAQQQQQQAEDARKLRRVRVREEV